MLKSLLLLCCAATIVSAGDLNNVNNTSSVPANPASSDVAVNPQSPATPNNGIQIPVSHESDTDAKSNNAAEVPNQIVIPTTMDPSKSTPSTKPTTPSTKPTIPSIKPTTSSTAKPTTSSTTTTSTTAAPTTPTPTTPLPPPSSGKWTVKENNTLCIIVQMAVQFNVSYINDKNMTIHKAMDVPSNGSVTGKCGKTEQNLTLSWASQDDTVQDNFTLHFVKNETDKHYSLHHLEISLTSEEFSNDKSNKIVTFVHMAPQFSTGLSNSYRCFQEQTLNLTLLGKNETMGHLKVSDLQFQAFRGDNSTVFGLAKDCSFNTPDIVPITVGCALAGLVVIVLIVYLVGRRRSQARGYLSM